MKISGDYHTHTIYSHGKGTVRDNVISAIKAGLKEIAITDHGLNHFILGLRWWKVIKITEEVKKLQAEFPDINILVGIESNLIGTRGRIDIKPEEFKAFDIILCGFHKPARPDRLKDWFGMYMRSYVKFIPQGRRAIRRNTRAYTEAVKKNPIDVLTHINKEIRIDAGEIARVCAEYGTYLELSSRHIVFSESDYKAMLDTDVKFILNSDAHRPEAVGDIRKAEEIIKKYNIPLERIVNIDGKKPVFRSQKEHYEI